MSIVANKVPGVYASPCQDVKTAFDARGINNSNVLTLGGMVTSNDNAKEIVETWLKTNFTSGWEEKEEVKVSYVIVFKFQSIFCDIYMITPFFV
jgi:ribose 5-phosphate isomerase RpiB